MGTDEYSQKKQKLSSYDRDIGVRQYPEITRNNPEITNMKTMEQVLIFGAATFNTQK